MTVKALYFSYIYKLEHILIVLNSPKTVGIYLFPNFVPIAIKKEISVTDYRWRIPLSSTQKGVRQGAGSYKLNYSREVI